MVSGTGNSKWSGRAVVVLAVVGAFCAFSGQSGMAEDAPGPTPFLGHYHYMIQLPKDYRAQADFEDPEQLVELVILHPAATQQELVTSELRGRFREALYGERGIIRIEAVPRDHPQFGGEFINLQHFRDTIPAHLQRMGDHFTLEELPLQYPAFLIKFETPQPMHQAFVEGAHVIYIVTAGPDNPALMDVLNSLKEDASIE